MTVIELPWPSRDLHPNARASGPWSAAEDEYLKMNHGSMLLQDIANNLRRSRCSLRARITRLGISKKVLWTAEEEQSLRDLYENAGPEGPVFLEAFARQMGRDAGNVSRKAGMMGLCTNPHRRTVEKRKTRQNKFSTKEELSAAISKRMKEHLALKGHSRGMAGKHHSAEVKMKISATHKALSLFIDPETRGERVFKAMKTRRENGTDLKVRRGSWLAGWREIGGNRNYYRSRWEANYARYLQWLKDRGEIADWKHEPETFWFEEIRRGVRSYLPDFRVWEKNGLSTLHEVKGWMDARSRTCLKRMAKYHPQEKIILIDGPQYRAIRMKVMRLVEGWEDSKRDSRA